MLRTVISKCLPDRQGFLSRLSRETLSTKDKGSFPREKVFPGNSLEEFLKTIKLFPALYLEMVSRQKADRRRGFFTTIKRMGRIKMREPRKELEAAQALPFSSVSNSKPLWLPLKQPKGSVYNSAYWFFLEKM